MRLIDADKLIEEMSLYKYVMFDKEVIENIINEDIDIINEGKETLIINQWVNVEDDLPKQRPSVFAKVYGTAQWDNAMWKSSSDDVIVNIEVPDRMNHKNVNIVTVGRLRDGKWQTNQPYKDGKVTHWSTFPKSPRKDEDE